MTELAQRLMPHLMVAPILLPMLAAAIMLLFKESQRKTKALVNVVAIVLGLGSALLLMAWVDAYDAPSEAGVYLAGNWRAPFGIVLVADRLSALMLVLTYSVALCLSLIHI